MNSCAICTNSLEHMCARHWRFFYLARSVTKKCQDTCKAACPFGQEHHCFRDIPTQQQVWACEPVFSRNIENKRFEAITCSQQILFITSMVEAEELVLIIFWMTMPKFREQPNILWILWYDMFIVALLCHSLPLMPCKTVIVFWRV